MPRKNGALGRGLDSLLPEMETEEGQHISMISLGDIDPNPGQPRRTFDGESIEALARSVREQGVLQPILVVPTAHGRYRIIAGERRYRAARLAELETIPCLVRDMEVAQQMEVALIENLQREDLNPLEAAQGIRALMTECGYTQEQAAQRLSKSRPVIANLLRILTLPEEIRQLVQEGTLSAGHARVLAGVEGADMQKALAQKAVDLEWSVREMEDAAAALRAPEAVKPPVISRKKPLTVEMEELRSHIGEATGLKCTMTGSEKKGKIVLQYYSREELERLYEVIARLRGEQA